MYQSNSNEVTPVENLMDIENYPQNVRKFVRPITKEVYQGGIPPSITAESYEEALIPSHKAVENYEPLLNCVNVANHVKNCPVCSKLYSNDKTLYIIIIVVLAVISALLLKKVLES